MYPHLRLSAARRFLLGCAPRALPVVGTASQVTTVAFSVSRSLPVAGLFTPISHCSPKSSSPLRSVVAEASPRAPPVVGAAWDELPASSGDPEDSPRAPPVVGGSWDVLLVSSGTVASPRALPVEEAAAGVLVAISAMLAVGCTMRGREGRWLHK